MHLVVTVFTSVNAEFNVLKVKITDIKYIKLFLKSAAYLRKR